MKSWYLDTTFIMAIFIVGTLFALMNLYIIAIAFIIAGIVLTILQNNEYKPIFDKIKIVNDIEIYRSKIEDELRKRKHEIEALKIKTTNDLEQMQNAALQKTAEAEKTLKLLTDKIRDQYYPSQLKAQLESQKSELEKEISNLQLQISDMLPAAVTPYIFEDDATTSEEYKNELTLLKTEENNFIKSDKCIVKTRLADNISKSILAHRIKQLLRCFNAESTYILSNVTIPNVDTCRNKLQKSYEIVNAMFADDGISLSNKMLEYKLKELNLQYASLKKKEIEKEQQKAIREQMIEEEKLRQEIESEKARIEKEEKQFKNEIDKLTIYMQNASDIDKQLYIDKIRELEAKIKLLEKDKENVFQREQNTRAGYVYIISNIGSFGENVYKIGMTRRLEPMDRIKELGSASVPFDFDVHALIFSDDAPSLENTLHKTFEKYAVNKVNLRKEFYRLDLHEIERVVLENHNATVIFTEIAKAEQYRETLKMSV